MKINLPDIKTQKKLIFEESTKEAIRILNANLKAPGFPGVTEIDENKYSRSHLLREHEGWEPPHQDIVGAYFRQFQDVFPAYGTDARLAHFLGLSSDRRVREFKNGDRKVPYGVWRKFLVVTGRVPQDVLKVEGYFE